MSNYVVSDTSLGAVADAIREKGGTTAALEYPEGFVQAISDIETGGGGGRVSVPSKDVDFIDYDGNIVYSYTAEEFLALSAMPENPDHSGDEVPLTAQGWNWTLAEAQEYVAKYGMLDVGQMYVPTDGKTHIKIHLEKGRTSPILGVCPNGTVDVDWGDGTAHSTLTGTSVTKVQWTERHNYTAPGDYDIKLMCTGTMGFYGAASNNQFSGILRHTASGAGRNRAYLAAVQQIYCANNVVSISSYAFQNCIDLSCIIISKRITSISTYAFSDCYSLNSIIIPNGVTVINDSANRYNYNLEKVSISSSVESIQGYAFNYCLRLIRLAIPIGIKTLGANIFETCESMRNVIVPNSVTSIYTSAFSSCYILSKITIPNSVTDIGTYVFANCYSLAEVHIKCTTPPTLANTNAFSNSIGADCKIYVPYSEDHSILEAYKSATNWSTYASKMQEEPQ